MDEIWKPVQNYVGYYEVSNLGRIRSMDRTVKYPNFDKRLKGRLLKHRTQWTGYETVDLCIQGTVKRHFVHVLVLESFIGRKPKGKETRHKDGIRKNNVLNNLSWGTRSENATDRAEHAGKGVKLTPYDINLIRKCAKEGGRINQIADHWDVNRRTIYCIVSGKSWKRLYLGG